MKLAIVEANVIDPAIFCSPVTLCYSGDVKSKTTFPGPHFTVGEG